MRYCRCVIESKRVKNQNVRNCFQRVFVLQDFFIFRKIVIFMMNCTRWFKIFVIFLFEKSHLGIRIDAKTVFTFLFFLWMPLKNQRSMMEKTVKIGFFTFFINFPSLKNHFPKISSWELKQTFEHTSVGFKNQKIMKFSQNCFFNLGWWGDTKIVFFMFFQAFFKHLNPTDVCISQSPLGDPS